MRGRNGVAGFQAGFWRAVVIFACLIQAVPLAAQSRTAGGNSGSISLRLLPTLMVPIADSASLFTLGGGTTVGWEFGFGESIFRPTFGAVLYYGLSPFKADQSLSMISLEPAGGIEVQIASRLNLDALATVGYSYDVINQDGTSGGHAVFSAGIGASYLMSTFFDLRGGVSYRNYLGLYHGVMVELGASFFVRGRQERGIRIEQGQPLRAELLIDAKRDAPGKGIDLESIEIDEIFPVFRTYYVMNPVGRAVLVNKEQVPVTDVKLTFFVKQYMDNPRAAEDVPSRFGPGESHAVDLVSLFTEKILEVTESTKVNAEIVFEYRLNDELFRDARNVTVRLLDRNAIRWDDDRKAAAFVTAKDPAVLAFSKNTAGLVRGKGPQAVDSTILTAIGLYESLALEPYRLSYVVDPKTPFVEYSQDTAAVDYLQFPRQTLSYRGGDCDDLSILYAALLESVGIETAFVTVPSHIFMAFATEVRELEVGDQFTSTEDLIVREGKVWMPIEMTLRRDSFLAAWKEGARQWREAEAKKRASFYPVHQAWKDFEPVGLPGGSGEIPLPAAGSVESAFLQQAVRFVDQELLPKIKLQEQKIILSGADFREINKLGILYARYGRLEQAAEQFEKAVAKSEYLPALINLGNAYFLQKKLDKALPFFERAQRKEPGSPAALLGVSKVYYEQGQYDLAQSNYEKLLAVDAGLAKRFSYLGVGSADRLRASETGVQREAVTWSE